MELRNSKIALLRARAAHRICRILRFFGKICDRNPENATRIFRILDYDRRHLEFCLWQQSGLGAALPVQNAENNKPRGVLFI